MPTFCHLLRTLNPLNWTLVTLPLVLLPLPLVLLLLRLLMVAVLDCCCAPAVNFILQGIIRLRLRLRLGMPLRLRLGDLETYISMLIGFAIRAPEEQPEQRRSRNQFMEEFQSSCAREFEEKLNSPVNMNVSSATYLQMSYDRKEFRQTQTTRPASHKKMKTK